MGSKKLMLNVIISPLNALYIISRPLTLNCCELYSFNCKSLKDSKLKGRYEIGNFAFNHTLESSMEIYWEYIIFTIYT
jgi:hypothetical protein